MVSSVRSRKADDPGGTVLPERLQQAIRQEQDRSEILIGWIQLAVIGTFAMLYFLAPKTAGAAGVITAWAIGAYLGLTVVRLVLAHLFSLPGWILALSVLADMTLLFGLIWSFHLQYDQPPAFYLKVPTLLYVFIFIALRALRFEARYVVLAGVVAALGWFAMVLYAVTADPWDDMVTRDYVRYMTSNSILIGAEFDKIVSILVVTAIIGVGLVRARRLLERAVAEGIAKQDLSRFFAPEIARRITGAGREIMAGAGEARDAAILNLDVRGFTRLARDLDPDAVMAVLAEYQSRMVPIIQLHGGSIDKFLGDGIMATFGAARPSETYAADALRALDELMSAAAQWSAEKQAADDLQLAINGAIATGRIVFGAVGDKTRLEYTVIGDAVNLSAKIEKHNKSLGTRALVTAEAYDLALAQGYAPPVPYRRHPNTVVAGVDEPLDVVIVAA